MLRSACFFFYNFTRALSERHVYGESGDHVGFCVIDSIFKSSPTIFCRARGAFGSTLPALPFYISRKTTQIKIICRWANTDNSVQFIISV